MATAREFYERLSSDNMRLTATQTLTHKETGEAIEVIAGLSLDFEAGAKFGLLYIPQTAAVQNFISFYISNVDQLVKVGDGRGAIAGFQGTNESIDSASLVFSRRINVYTPSLIDPKSTEDLHKLAAANGLTLVIRDRAYAEARSSLEHPVAFISHDSRDKDSFVREFVLELQKLMCTVWYDEYSLLPGASLRENIERGLKTCKKCVVILSPHFFANEGWTKAEFDSIFTREILEKRNVIIPIWHGVTKEDVYAYSPRLLDRLGVPTDIGASEVARKVQRAIVQSD